MTNITPKPKPECSCETGPRQLCERHYPYSAVCKHCTQLITSSTGQPHTYVHVYGAQQGKHRCELDPYGYNAEPQGTPCSFTCLAYEGVSQ